MKLTSKTCRGGFRGFGKPFETVTVSAYNAGGSLSIQPGCRDGFAGWRQARAESEAQIWAVESILSKSFSFGVGQNPEFEVSHSWILLFAGYRKKTAGRGSR